MKNLFLMLFLILGFPVFLTGCLSQSGSGITQTVTQSKPDGEMVTTTTDGYTEIMAYQEAAKEHHASEAKRIDSQAEAIALIDTTGLSKDAKALLAVQQIQAIQGLTPVPFSGKAPTTWKDVANTVAGETGEIVRAGVLWKGLDTVGKVFDNAGDSTNVSMGSGSSAAGFNKTSTTQMATIEADDDGTLDFDPISTGYPAGSADSSETTNTTTTLPLLE